MKRRKIKLASCLAWGAMGLVFVTMADPARFGDAWDWALPPREFGGMSQAERMVYERAEKLFRDGNYESAAAEFEKFSLEYPRAGARSHALLMRGFSLHRARQRNQALAIYTEVLDLFGEQLQVAVPAAYLRAHAQIENGNLETGYGRMEEMIDNRQYPSHPLFDVVLQRLAERSLEKEQPETAERYWQRILTLHEEAFVRPEDAARDARLALIDLYVARGRISALDTLLARDRLPGAEAHIRDRVVAVSKRAERLFSTMEEAARRQYARWLASKDDLFVTHQERTDYHTIMLDYALRMQSPEDAVRPFERLLALCGEGEMQGRMRAAVTLASRLAEAEKLGWGRLGSFWEKLSDVVLPMGEAASFADRLALYEQMIAAMKFPKRNGSEAGTFWDTLVSRSVKSYENLLGPERDRKLIRLVDQVRLYGSIDRAVAITRNMVDGGAAAWERIRLLGHRERWREMAEACKELEDRNLEPHSGKALRARADLYRQRLGQYEEAITLYRMLNDPPETLWKIVECYERLNQLEKAVETCVQIEGFFKEDAARAAFRIARIWEQSDNRTKAVAAARAVLRKYPEHQVSSQAHQMLERYGIDTGGGLFEAEG